MTPVVAGRATAAQRAPNGNPSDTRAMPGIGLRRYVAARIAR
jgi:hypothetical protein